jgi:hypothetical protein
MRTSGSGHWQHERRLIAILATLFSGKPCAWTARSGQTQKGTAHRRPLDTTRQSDRWRQLSVRSPVVGECCVGVRGRCAPTHGVDHPRALAGARSLPWLLTAGCRSRIARCGIVVIHDALIGVMFIGVAGHRIARCGVVVVQDPLIGVVLFAGHVWILWTVVGASAQAAALTTIKAAATPILRSVLLILTSLLSPSCANLSARLVATGPRALSLITAIDARAFILSRYGAGRFARCRQNQAIGAMEEI